jgi:hypothetical protein
MEYISNISEIQNHHLIFKMPIKNQNSKYLYYYKLLYSDRYIHLKYLLFRLDFVSVHSNGKVNKQDPIFEKIKHIETTILESLNQNLNKKLKSSLYHEIIQKDIYQNRQPQLFQPLFLKISGIWEDTTHIGLVYKLYYSSTCSLL